MKTPFLTGPLVSVVFLVVYFVVGSLACRMRVALVNCDNCISQRWLKYVAILSSQLFGLNLCLKEARLKDYNFGQGSRAFWDIQREKTTEALTGKGFWAEMGLYEVST